MLVKCAATGRNFDLSGQDYDFYNQMQVNPPTLCPDERQRRRLAYRNERTLYYRKCSATNSRMLSIYSSDKPFPVFENDYWWSDDWNAFDYARDYDFSKSFFEQFNALEQVVPHCSLTVIKPTIENSDYCNQAGFIKNCYIIFDSRRSESCMYGKTMERCYDCVDCLKVFDCEACYEVVASQLCQYCSYILNCSNCHDCYFSRNLVGCSYCFGCTNLRNKQYYLFNEQLGKEAWIEKTQSLFKERTLEEHWEDFLSFEKKQFVKWMQERNTEDCVGDYLVDCKDCYYCFDSEYLEQCRYCYDLKKDDAVNYNNYDVCHFGGNVEHCYECCSIGNTASMLRFCENVWSCSDITYSRFCTQSRDLFGCFGLRNAEYCILNKTYPKAEYFELVARIIQQMKKTGEWGEFFPISYSPYGYNETLAQEYFPVNETEAMKNAWKWKVEEKPKEVVNPFVPPDRIENVSDDIVSKTLTCEISKRPYRITKQELAFYRKRQIPIPRICFEERHARRMALRNPRYLYKRTCAESGKEILTTAAPEKYSTVYSRGAYQSAVE